MINEGHKVAICGGGQMGTGIAQLAAQAGHRVIVLDTDAASIERSRRQIERDLARLVSRNKLDSEGASQVAHNLTWTSRVEDLVDSAIVIEAIFENLEIKKQLFASIEAVVAEEAVIASNTSSLSIAALAATLSYPRRFIGLHFFNPPPVMELVEVIAAPASQGDLVSGVIDLMKRWGKVPVIAKDTPGFIVNRVARPYYSEGWRAYQEGAADAATLDFIYRDQAGFRMGPLELGDAIGHDINFASACSIFGAYFGRTRFTPSVGQGQLVAAGRLGRKSGRGVYDYGDQALRPEPFFLDTSGGKSGDEVVLMPSDGRPASAVANELDRPVAVFDHAARAGAESLVFAASDDAARGAALAHARSLNKKAIEVRDRPGMVVLRTLLQLVNAAADALSDGIASREAIDLAMIKGVNYPFGLFDWGERFGWRSAVTALEVIAAETGDSSYLPGEVLRLLARTQDAAPG